jgi:hypothetical protein
MRIIPDYPMHPNRMRLMSSPFYDYINSNQVLPLVFKCISMELSASVDASHDIHRDNKGHSGLVVSIGNVPVFHRSTKQKLVSTSAMQAEIVAFFESFPTFPGSEIFWRSLDTQSSLSLFNGSGQADTRKTRHYQNKIAFIKEQVAGGVLQLQYVPTEEMLADRLTKPFGGAKMTEFFGVGT